MPGYYCPFLLVPFLFHGAKLGQSGNYRERVATNCSNSTTNIGKNSAFRGWFAPESLLSSFSCSHQLLNPGGAGDYICFQVAENGV